jgi:hypothetical protein
MKDRTDSFPLTVQVPADEWAYVNRRMVYLEAVLVQVLRGRGRIQEWYAAADLAALRLPGIPTSKGAVTRAANEGGWLRREVKGRGGLRFQYHCTSLPSRAFDALVIRILNLSSQPGVHIDKLVPKIEAAPIPRAPNPDNTAPPWVLPFMRLLKGGAHGDLSAAWQALPEQLHHSIPLPTMEEAAETIVRLGLHKEGS